MLSWFSGVRLYALLGVGALLVALSGAVAYLWQVHKLDVAKREQDQRSIDTLTQAIKQEEADKADLARKAQTLDGLLVAQRKRADALQISNSKLSDQLHALESTLPKEDQDCAARPLPDSVLEWLRDGSTDSNAVRQQSPT